MSSPSSSGPPPSDLPPSGAAPADPPESQPPTAPTAQIDFNIGEEYGTARKSLPPAGIVAICIAVVAVVIAGYALTHRAHALSTGSIDDVTSVAVPSQNMVMVAINVSLQNNSDKPAWIHTIQALLDTGSNKFSDDAAPAVDAERYFQAFPDLKQHALAFLKPEMRLNSGDKVSGTIVVSFPVTADAFAARKSLTVTVSPYDELPVVIRK